MPSRDGPLVHVLKIYMFEMAKSPPTSNPVDIFSCLQDRLSALQNPMASTLLGMWWHPTPSEITNNGNNILFHFWRWCMLRGVWKSYVRGYMALACQH